MNIISASRRTDIPAFYSEWFMNRVREGRVRYANPFSGQVYEVSLRPEDVHSIVFWSKNFQPLEPCLPRLEVVGYDFVFHYTITGLPRVFESSVIPWEKAVLSFRRLSDRYGPKRVMWRFDPIIFSRPCETGSHATFLGSDFFKKTFERLARRLEGATERCYFSFVALYSKVLRNIKILESVDPPEADIHTPLYPLLIEGISSDVRLRRTGLHKRPGAGLKPAPANFCDPSHEEKVSLVETLVEIATSRGITLYTCCDAALTVKGVRPAQCVDGELLYELFPHKPKQTKIVPTRKGCNCVQSRDIGAYDTCPHGCVYCYANLNYELALGRYEAHDAASDILLPVPGARGQGLGVRE
jgi:hypothetical protein